MSNSVLGINQGTNAFINFDLSGTINTQVIGVGYGTISTLGTLPNLPQGTLGSILGIGSVSGLSNLPGGSITVTTGTIPTLGTMGTLGLLVNGTLANSGTTTGVGTITNIGTLGTATGIGSVGGLGTLPGVGVVTSLTNGSINIPNGTLQALGTLGTVGTIANLGSITNLGQIYNAGTLQAGTINAGTFRGDARTTQNIVSYGTQQIGTAAIVATIIGSASVGAGTSLWINDMSIMNPYGSVLCVLGFGTAQQGTNVLFRGILGTQTAIGIEKSYAKMVNAGMTNQDLVFSLGGAGTVDLSFSYLIST